MADCFGYGMGYEIEAYNMDLWALKEQMENAFLLPKKVGYKKNFSKYLISEEEDITIKSDSFYGGEVSSPILYNQKSLQESILYVLEILQKNHARNLDSFHSSASLHFHFGLEAFQHNYQNCYRFIKFMHAFCGEIYEYSHEENGSIRRSVYKYASPYLKEELDRLFQRLNNFQDMQEIPSRGRIPAPLFPFASKTHMYRFTKNTIEVRTCNCPIPPTKEDFNIKASYEQFMRYFSFYQKLIEYISSNQFDQELIDYYYEKERENPYIADKQRLTSLKRILKIKE